MSKHLRLTLPLLPDETASSFASRLAKRNCISDLPTFCDDLGLGYQGLRLGKDAALHKLSTLSGASFDQLRKQTIAYVGQSTYRFGEITARRTFLKRYLFRFCPECLNEDLGTDGEGTPYARNIWEFEVLQCCHRHKCLLVERDSMGSVDFVKLYIEHVHCETTFEKVRINQSHCHLESYLRKRINKSKTGSWFDDIPIHAVKSFCEYFGALILFGPKTKRSSISKMNWLRAGSFGFNQLVKDKSVFTKSVSGLKSINAFAMDRRRDDFGFFANWLHDQKKNPEFNFARDLFREFILDTYPLAAGTSVYGLPLKKRRLHTIPSAISEGKLNSTIFKVFLIENGYAKKSEGSYKVTQTKPILVIDIPRMKNEMSKLIRTTQAAEQLGMTARQLRRMNLEGLLKSIDGGLTVYPLYHFHELVAFEGKLKRVSHSVDVLPEGTVSFGDAAVYFSITHRELLGRILKGDIEPAMYLKRSCKLFDLFLDRSALRAALLHPCEHGISLHDVGEMLALNRTTISYFIKAGIFEVTQQVKLQGCIIQKAICSKSIKEFDTEWVSLQKLCTEKNKSIMSINRKIKKMEIKPMFDAKYQSKVFRRSEVEIL